jgi:hypothetical protein
MLKNFIEFLPTSKSSLIEMDMLESTVMGQIVPCALGRLENMCCEVEMGEVKQKPSC